LINISHHATGQMVSYDNNPDSSSRKRSQGQGDKADPNVSGFMQKKKTPALNDNVMTIKDRHYTEQGLLKQSKQQLENLFSKWDEKQGPVHKVSGGSRNFEDRSSQNNSNARVVNYDSVQITHESADQYMHIVQQLDHRLKDQAMGKQQ
jgi:hypothetical protein